jgi:hypothetical protein
VASDWWRSYALRGSGVMQWAFALCGKIIGFGEVG